MGFNTTVVLLNDRLHDYQENAQQVMNTICARASVCMDDAQEKKWPELYKQPFPSQYRLGYGASIPSIHHADRTALIAVGGNCATTLIEVGDWHHATNDGQIGLLKALAAKLGYRIIKKN